MIAFIGLMRKVVRARHNDHFLRAYVSPREKIFHPLFASVDEIFAEETVDSTPGPADILWYLTDRLGSVTNVVRYGATKTEVVQRLTYNSFGEIVHKSDDNALTPRFTYASMEFDPETGLHYDHARYYSSTMTRFISADPSGFADSAN